MKKDQEEKIRTLQDLIKKTRLPPIHKRQGANLPHWRMDGAIYNVTFRLADSLPTIVLNAWRSEKAEIEQRVRDQKRSYTRYETERLKELSSARVEKYLQQGHGSCWLRRLAIASMVAEALRKFDLKHYRLFAWCIMPNHMHVVVQPYLGYTLEKILQSWKTFTAKEANRLLGRTGTFWMAEYYDHLVRDRDDLIRCINYVWENPEKAKMKEWMWRWKIDFDSLDTMSKPQY